jgi:aerobic-type carbon monoxide dehydrogenase small subunit (CoxS/CutS family)
MSGVQGFRFSLNGKTVDVEAPPMQRLLDVLRESFGLTGTKNGCGEGDCGACTVLMEGRPVASCLVPIVQAEGADVRTVEDLDEHGHLSRLQQAFMDCGAAQCGSCTPGMLMTATAYLRDIGSADEATIRSVLAGNLCRCTGYGAVIEAIRRVAEDGS